MIATETPTLMDQDQYVSTYGLHCPFCRGLDVSRSAPVMRDVARLSAEAECSRCGGRWCIVYELTGYRLQNRLTHGGE